MTTKQKQARQARAATRLQATNSTWISPNWDEAAVELMLNAKLREFEALCRAKVIAYSNVYGAACNVLVAAAKTLKPVEHQKWLAIFTKKGEAAALNASV